MIAPETEIVQLLDQVKWKGMKIRGGDYDSGTIIKYLDPVTKSNIFC